MHLLPGVLLRRDPGAEPAPVVFDVPRSGTWYPCDFRPDAPFQDVHRSVSMHLGELYDIVPESGATLLYALFPNAYIDANRHETDIDPELLADEWRGPGVLAPTVKSKLGIGLIHSLAGDRPLYQRKLTAADIRNRIESYFLPYHDELARLITARHAAAGVSYHVSCHSMASIGGRSTLDVGEQRSDFDIGDLNGASCDPEFSELVVSTLRQFGYKVTSNFHYAGAESIRRHAAPAAGRHSIQIELNRKLYMNEAEFTKTAGFAEVQTAIATLAGAIRDYAAAKSRLTASHLTASRPTASRQA